MHQRQRRVTRFEGTFILSSTCKGPLRSVIEGWGGCGRFKRQNLSQRHQSKEDGNVKQEASRLTQSITLQSKLHRDCDVCHRTWPLPPSDANEMLERSAVQYFVNRGRLPVQFHLQDVGHIAYFICFRCTTPITQSEPFSVSACVSRRRLL